MDMSVKCESCGQFEGFCVYDCPELIISFIENKSFDIENIDDIIKSIKQNTNVMKFLFSWKSSNFFRIQQKNIKFLDINTYFTQQDIEILRYLKGPEPQKLYRGITLNYKPKTFDTYIDKFPSSWSTDFNICKLFSRPIQGYYSIIFYETFEPQYILADFNFISNIYKIILHFNNEKEIIILPGSYPINIHSIYYTDYNNVTIKLQ